ncbi:hypothetical protein [Pricia sp.]|uniref:hypothetical protein n=1 Tax=Pricia sp. TaxID=2268138 RepID=UPI0035937A08
MKVANAVIVPFLKKTENGFLLSWKAMEVKYNATKILASTAKKLKNRMIVSGMAVTRLEHRNKLSHYGKPSRYETDRFHRFLRSP